MATKKELEKVVPFRHYLHIKCPMCKQKQTMKYDSRGRIYFPASPFCCDVMRNADSPEWNVQLDIAIKDARDTRLAYLKKVVIK